MAEKFTCKNVYDHDLCQGIPLMIMMQNQNEHDRVLLAMINCCENYIHDSSCLKGKLYEDTAIYL